METEERMSPSQVYLFEKVVNKREERLKLVFEKAKLTAGQQSELEKAHWRLRKSKIVVNLSLHERAFGDPLIDSLLDARRLYNVFEIAHAGEMANPTRMRIRIMLEFKVYGATNNIQSVLGGMSNTEHPNYGILDYFNHPIGISMLGGYGWYRFICNHRVKYRSTFAPADSLYITSDQVFRFADIEGILASRPYPGSGYWFEYVNTGTVPIDQNGNACYIEAQILGGISLKKDVETICHPETDKFNKSFLKKLQRFKTEFGIELKKY
jgi:hypothetical protein